MSHLIAQCTPGYWNAGVKLLAEIFHAWHDVSVQRLGLKKPLMKNKTPKTYKGSASSEK
jgi:hypothetical protein